MMITIKRILRPIYGRPLAWFRKKKRQYVLASMLRGSDALFLGTPEHSNLGDSAIALAELFFLEVCGFDRRKIAEFTAREYMESRMVIKRYAPTDKPVFLIGGGNMGNQWMNEEVLRRVIVEDFRHSKKVLFPQTLYYTSTKEGAAEKQNSVAYYNTAGFTLVARERPSYDAMCSLYPDADVLLVPDIVLSADMDVFGAVRRSRQGVLLCMRSDVEKLLTTEQQTQIEKVLRQNGLDYTLTDMHAKGCVTKANRSDFVREKMNEFTGAELVITDRLHGMIFAAITETPCIAFGNYNHKVAGTYEWLRHLPYIKYVSSVEEMSQLLPELLNGVDCHFDNVPLLPYFQKLAEVVKTNAADKCNCSGIQS